MNPKEAWFAILNEQEVDSPALLVYPDRITENIALAKSIIGDVNRLRPHVKTHKSKAITLMQMAAGIRKFKCATLAEAGMLGECEAPDVLIAYPLLGPRLMSLFDLISKYRKTRFSAIVDHPEAAQSLSDAAIQAGIVVNTFIDLDIGMGRTGIPAGAAAMDFLKNCRQKAGLNIQGFHAYDGHVHERDFISREQQCEENFRPLQLMLNRLTSENFPQPRIVIGGSPSFPVYARYPGVECSPGTFILWDRGYATDLPDQPFLPAAVLLTRIISFPDNNTICVDLGHKAVGAENPIDKRVFFLNAPTLQPLRQSEEHLVLKAPEGHSFQLGDVLYGIPYHVCPTVNLYDSMNVVEAQRVNASWPVDARQRYHHPVTKMTL